MPSYRLICLSLLVALAPLVLGCAQTSARGTDNGIASQAAADGPQTVPGTPEDFEERARRVFGTRSLARAGADASSMDGDFLYKFLLGEIAAQRGDLRVAAQAYLELAKSTHDARLARRATEMAMFGRFNDMAVQAARIWLDAEPGSLPARQSLVSIYLTQNDLKAAKPLLKDILAASDNQEQALMQLHALLAKYPDKRETREVLKELTAPYLKIPEAHYALAQAAFFAGDSAAALSEIREALRLRPDWEWGALFQAQVLATQSRASALDYLKTYLGAHPGAQEVRLTYARQLIGDKKYPPARAEFQRLLQSNPQNSELAVTVALLSLEMGDLDTAESQLKRVLQMQYKDPDALRFHLGQVAEERKRYDEAAKWYQSVSGGEQYISANARYALLLAKQNKLAEAREHLQSLPASDDSQRVQLIQAEAQLLREARAFEESYSILKKGLDKMPDQPELLYDVALAAEKVNRLEVVETNLRRLIVLKPDHAQAYNALGYTLADRTNRLAEARGLIEKALQMSPEDAFILDSMGWVEYRLGRLAEGLDYLQRAFRQRQDPEIAAHLGEVLWAKGQKQEAERVWRDALRDHPDSEELKSVLRKFIP
jgi:tetratricopeptide (TPR) repeat protein